MTNIQHLIENLAKLASHAKFASLVYKTKEKTNKAGVVVDGGETARYTLILGAKYHKTVEDSLLALLLLNVNDIAAELNIPVELAKEASEDLLASFRKTLEAAKNGEQNSDYTKIGLYVPIVAGLNVNSNDGTFQLFGLVQSKVVLNEGVRKPVNSSPLTIAKNKIRKMLPIGRFREFAIDAGNAQTAKLNGETLELG